MDILAPARFCTAEFEEKARDTGWMGRFIPVEPVRRGWIERFRNRLLKRPQASMDVVLPEEELLAQVEILMHAWPMNERDLEAIVPRLTGLRWIHSAYTGVESAARVLPGRDIALTNAGSQTTQVVVEHALALILASARRLPEHFTATERRQWVTPPARVLTGSTVMILGLGRIGRELAKVTAALGCHVVGVRRNADLGTPEGVSELLSAEQVPSWLGKSDFVVLALPATHETTNFVDSEFLAAMRSDSVLVSVGRGETISEEALVDSLHRGHPRAAYLDVTRLEPLPRDSPLYRAPNLWLTHHTAYRTGDGEHGRNAERVFLENLGRFVKDMQLHDQVDPARGY